MATGLIGQANQVKQPTQMKDLEQLYRDQLGRDIGDEGRDYWGGLIAQGKANINDVTYAMEQTDEYKNFQSTGKSTYQPPNRTATAAGTTTPNHTATSTGTTQTQPTTPQATTQPPASANSQVIDSIYQNTLGRSPDAAGKQYWLEQINSGQMSVEDARKHIAAGAENQSLLRSAQQGTATTVQDRLQGLLSEGSKYLDVARQGAAEQANSRGFLNSTMAAGAGERAAIEAALPIAQQDAQLLTSTSLQNAGETNQMRGQVLDEQLQRWSTLTNQQHDKVMSELGYSQEQGLIDQKAYANIRGQYLDAMTQLAQTTSINISEIQSNPNIPAEEKQKMIENQIAMRTADLNGLSSLFSQMPMWQESWSQAAGNSPKGSGSVNTDAWSGSSSSTGGAQSTGGASQSGQPASNQGEQAIQQVDGLYSNLLGRSIGQEGRDYWTQQLNNGASLADVEWTIKQGNEYKLNQMYKSLVGRNLGDEGRKYWLEQLNNGASMADVEWALKQSDEYKNR